MDDTKEANERLLEELKGLRERLATLKRAEAGGRKADAALEARALYWATVSAIGQSAVAGKDLQTLMDEATSRMARTLDVEYCAILELLPDGQALLVRSGFGWKEGIVGRLTVPARPGSQAGYTLLSSAPVVIEDLRTDRRFHLSSALHDQKVVSGMSVTIRGRDRPFGVLGVHTTRRRAFTRGDTDFLEAVANVLAAAIDRLHGEDALRESERRFRDLVETVHLVAVMLNPRGNILFCNDYLLRLSGWRRDEVVGRSWFQTFLPADVRASVQKTFEETIHTGAIPAHDENEIQTRAGERRLIAWNNTVLHDLQGNVTGTMSLGEDVTDRRRAEETLRGSEERYRLLFESNPHPMWVYESGTLRFLAVNDAAIRAYGYAREEFLAMTLKDIRPEEDLPTFLEAVARERLALTWPGVWRHRRKDGTVFDAEITVHSLVFDGRPAGLVLAMDVTDRRRAEQALKDSEARFRLVARATNDAIWDWDLQTDRVEWNEGVRALFGYRREDVGSAASWWVDNIHPEDRERVASGIHAVIDGGGTDWRDEYRFRKADQSYARVIDRGYVVHDDHGTPVRMIGSMMDMTELKRAEAALADEKERLAVTLRSIGDAVITTDREGCVVLMNQVAEELTGFTHRQAAGRALAEIFQILDETTRRPGRNPVEEVLRDGVPFALPRGTLLRSKDGAERVIADSGAPIRDHDGNVIGVVLVFRDVTELRRAEEELLKASKLESVGVLAGGIAHDFNNILTAILGNILLNKMSLDPENPSYKRLVEAESACLRAKDLTKQLLTFSTGGEPVKKPTSMAALARESAAFALRGSNVKCEDLLPADLWPVDVDEGQMRQVINSLVLNAQQAMAAGGTVRIRGQNVSLGPGETGNGSSVAPGRYVRISVEDHGVGIPPENLTRIFDPYFTTRPSGSGLGLAIAYSIVLKHEGQITVESTVGLGSTFHVLLPASTRPAAEVEAPRPAAARVAQDLDGEADGEQPPARGRILVMDDEEMIKEVTGGMLRLFGYTPEFAGDGAEAITLYEKARQAGRPYCAVILDLTIPGGMGGAETIRRLRGIDPDVRAIVSSGYSNDPIMADFRRHGFGGVVAKPFTLEELREALDRVLGARQG